MSWVGNWLSEESLGWNVEDYLPRMTCPVLAIQGDQDHFGSYAQLESIQKNAGGPARILYIEGCGHIPHKQAKDQVLDTMADFILNIVSINQK